MSTWTDDKHEAARARCEAATEGPWDAQPDRTGTATIVLDQEGYALWDVLGTLLDKDGEFIAHARADLADALDEIERLRALTTITDNMVERAAREIYGPARWDSDIFFERSPNSYWPHLAQGIYDARDKARATLESALNPPA